MIVAGVLGVGAATFLACDSSGSNADNSAGAAGSISASAGGGAKAGTGASAAAEAGVGGSSSSSTQVSCESSSSTADNSDLVNGPAGGGAPGMGGMMGTGTSGGDAKYPSQLTYPTGTSGRGVSVGSLSSDQKVLVRTAIEAWVKNVADPVSSALIGVYESDDALAQTYVGFSGSADLSTQTSYVRIDGPRVWIEVTIQGGIVYHDRVHYHTIWRDKAADYGAEYAGS